MYVGTNNDVILNFAHINLTSFDLEYLKAATILKVLGFKRHCRHFDYFKESTDPANSFRSIDLSKAIKKKCLLLSEFLSQADTRTPARTYGKGLQGLSTEKFS